MNEVTFLMIASVVVGGFMIAQGLPGLLSGDMILRGRYGWRTHYTGAKATVLGFGYVGAGAFLLINGILLMLIAPDRLTTANSMLFMGIALIPICALITLFVSGTAKRER